MKRVTNHAATISAAAFCLAILLIATSATAITVGPFSPSGTGGSLRGQTLTIGDGGDVYELDAFVHVAGRDLNGGRAGSAAALSTDALPPELSLSFASSLSADGSDLILAYEVENVSVETIIGMTFVSYVDAEIDEPKNSFFNEVAATSGSLASGQAFEVDEPGFSSGDIYDNASNAALDGANASTTADDVAMAFSFLFPELAPGEVARIEVMLSEDGDRLGDFAIRQSDTDPSSPTTIDFSGRGILIPIPEPGAALLYGLALVLLVRPAMREGTRRSC